MAPTTETPPSRRPIATRNLRAVQRCAAWLSDRGISPNSISVISVVFALAAGLALAATSRSAAPNARWLWLAGAALIQLRLLANLFDGLVAVEYGKASPVGELYNEVPDRLSDSLILIGAGYAAGGQVVPGYLAALVALFVAYVRAAGASVGVGHFFVGPMAKQQRMFLVTLVALFHGLTPMSWQPLHPTPGWGPSAAALLVIVALGIVTGLRRLSLIAGALRAR